MINDKFIDRPIEEILDELHEEQQYDALQDELDVAV